MRPVLATEARAARPAQNLYEVPAEAFMADHALSEEVFGPLGLVVRVANAEDMPALAA